MKKFSLLFCCFMPFGATIQAQTSAPSDVQISASTQVIASSNANGSGYKDTKKVQQISFFQGNLEDALAEAKCQGKPLFIDFYTEKCAPCKQMDKETFADETVIDFTEQNYVAYKVNGDDAQGKDMANIYGIKAFPSFYFYSPNGEIVGKESGFMDAKNFLGKMQKYNPKKEIKKETSNAPTEEKGITFFKGDWKELLAKAKKSGKPFFVDFYTTWCGPCKIMSKTTFKDEKVGKFANDHFVAYKLNAEKGEGVQLSEKYEVQAYPTIMFFDEDGKKIGEAVGLQDAKLFLATLKEYKAK